MCLLHCVCVYIIVCVCICVYYIVSVSTYHCVCVCTQSGSRRIQQVFERHRRVCHVLLCAYESLQSSFESLIGHLPSSKQIELGMFSSTC